MTCPFCKHHNPACSKVPFVYSSMVDKRAEDLVEGESTLSLNNQYPYHHCPVEIPDGFPSNENPSSCRANIERLSSPRRHCKEYQWDEFIPLVVRQHGRHATRFIACAAATYSRYLCSALSFGLFLPFLPKRDTAVGAKMNPALLASRKA